MNRNYVYICSVKRHCGEDRKIGRTADLFNRTGTLNTSLSRHGVTFEILIPYTSIVESEELENYLHIYYDEFSTRHADDYDGGGIEWFSKKFSKEELLKALDEEGYDNEVIDDAEEIRKFQEMYEAKVSEYKKRRQGARDRLNKRIKKRRDNITNLKMAHMRNTLRFYWNRWMSNRKPNSLALYPFQEDDIQDLINHYETESKAVVNWICRLGKTILSVALIQKISYDKVFIGVPNIKLLGQWNRTIRKYLRNYTITTIGDKNTFDKGVYAKLHRDTDKLITITTYHSAHKLIEFEYDLKVLDECHHLVFRSNEIEDVGISDDGDDGETSGSKGKGKFREVHEIKSKHQLSLTATMKIDATEEGAAITYIGNDDPTYFGKVISNRNLTWAIANKKVCDYIITTPQLNIDDFKDKIKELNIVGVDEDVLCNLYLGAVSMLKLIKDGKGQRILNFANKCEHSKICEKIINHLLNEANGEFFELREDLFNTVIISGQSSKKEEALLDQFRNSKCGIINCVMKLGEGFDEKAIDTVCISEKMYSKVRILQSLLRPHTLDSDRPDKLAKILIPIAQTDEWSPFEDTVGFKMVIHVIDELTDVDENVWDKISIPKPRKNKKHEKGAMIDYDDMEDRLFTQAVRLRYYSKNGIPLKSYSIQTFPQSDYDIFTENGLIQLIPKIKYLSDQEFEKIYLSKLNNLSKSNITKCDIRDDLIIISQGKTKYRRILIDVWKSMEKKVILDKSKYNFKHTDEKGERGYTWSQELGMSFRDKDSNGTMKEIINMVKLNNFTIDIEIQLENKEKIYYKV